jgi:hypothetical protein
VIDFNRFRVLGRFTIAIKVKSFSDGQSGDQRDHLNWDFFRKRLRVQDTEKFCAALQKKLQRGAIT